MKHEEEDEDETHEEDEARRENRQARFLKKINTKKSLIISIQIIESKNLHLSSTIYTCLEGIIRVYAF